MPPRLPRLLAAGLALAAVTLAAACSQQSPKQQAGSPVPAPEATAQFGDGPAPAVTPIGTGATASKAPAVLLADGRWPGFIKEVGGGTVAMDLVEFLTGDAATKAWRKKNPTAEQDWPDNDYFIVNDNTKLRKLTLASPVVVKVVGELGPGTEEDVAVTGLKKHFGDRLPDTLFWFTVKQGKVTKIEQQFLP